MVHVDELSKLVYPPVSRRIDFELMFGHLNQFNRFTLPTILQHLENKKPEHVCVCGRER